MAAARQPPLVVGNWKMNGRVADVAEVRTLGQVLIDHPAWARVVVCPPATLIHLVSHALEGSGVETGAQDCHAGPAAVTGGISAEMLADAGAAFVVVGHSERRRAFGETGRQTAEKARAALRAGLTPILCLGETLAQRQAGRTASWLRRQLREACPSEFSRGGFVVAYEPVWAIGTGLTPTPAQIAEAHAVVRSELAAAFGAAGERAAILYGGSVSADNAAPILAAPGVQGLLVGRASLRCADFLPIIHQANALRPPLREPLQPA